MTAKLAAAAAFAGAIVAANWLTSTYGLIPVGFGLTATAGTYLAGLTFVLRDAVQDTAGKRWALALVAVGAVVSYLIADPFIALASGVAFLVAELVDFGIYTPLRRHGYIRAAVASNIVGSFLDTVLFLWIAGFPIWGAVPGQMLAKATVTALVVAAVIGVRRSREAVAA